MKAGSSSPAKIILFGEHFVVNGNSAIAMTIDLPTIVIAEYTEVENITIASKNLNLEVTFTMNGRIQRSKGVNAEHRLHPIFKMIRSLLHNDKQGLKISIDSRVPIGMGLGSSAAIAVAIISSLATLTGRTMQKDEIFQAAYSLEKQIHGRPSGIDQATVTYGGMIIYRNGKVETRYSELPKLPRIIIGNTGKRRSTGEYVGKVTQLRTDHPQEYARLSNEAQKVAGRAIFALKEGKDQELGALMNENQTLLERIGVSAPSLDNLIVAARTAGALGAKLTGGGGGGCMIALANDTNAATVAQAIQNAGGEVISSQFAKDGVKPIEWNE